MCLPEQNNWICEVTISFLYCLSWAKAYFYKFNGYLGKSVP